MEEVLEILKYILPALIVFATVYFILKRYLNMQYSTQVLKYRQEIAKNTLPIKLKAYERMAMFCERISLNNLSYRLSSQNSDAKSLGTAMLIAIQQEFEHNMSQQVYISEKLWQIITLAKDQMQNVITMAAADTPIGNSPAAIVQKTPELLQKMGGDPVETAKRAIRKEIETIL